MSSRSGNIPNRSGSGHAKKGNLQGVQLKSVDECCFDSDDSSIGESTFDSAEIQELLTRAKRKTSSQITNPPTQIRIQSSESTLVRPEKKSSRKRKLSPPTNLHSSETPSSDQGPSFSVDSDRRMLSLFSGIQEMFHAMEEAIPLYGINNLNSTIIAAQTCITPRGVAATPLQDHGNGACKKPKYPQDARRMAPSTVSTSSDKYEFPDNVSEQSFASEKTASTVIVPRIEDSLSRSQTSHQENTYEDGKKSSCTIREIEFRRSISNISPDFTNEGQAVSYS